MATFPGGIWAPTTKVDAVDYVMAADINNMQNEVIAAQTAIGQEGNSGLCEGRLTGTTGVPVTTANLTTITSLKFTPFNGNRIALHNGTGWVTHIFTELSLAVPNTVLTMYDVFCYDNAGTPTLEALVWTNDTTRATALTTLDGVLVKTGATTRRYLGSFRTTGASGNTADSAEFRFVWNYYNRVEKNVYKYATDSHTYNTATFRVFNNAAATHIVGFIIGVPENIINGVCNFGIRMPSACGPFRVAFSHNSTTAILGVGMYLALATGGAQLTFSYFPYNHTFYPVAGYNYMHPMEKTDTTPSPNYDDYYFSFVIKC